ncbi:pyrophosphatase PpaX [Paenibacillus woosongensis]|uniref:Pyrophosphatase PpaX n=1 Tax=Paenibacillus woosongensis TaxID=307580 RepID=A0A7X2Z3V0_9BACL|nr:pyrophosphatase PpaX [Paenibacillus woosongensis]MUG47102.1 pyrophosphatase PpaX [Paenibacillus woosongensis]
MNIDTVLFDLDGTIVDTNELIIASFQHVLDKHKQPRTREQIIPYMGMTLEQQFQAFSGWEDVAELVTDYRSFNTMHHDTMVKGFPHVDEVISTLKEKGMKLGIVTTKIRPSTMRVLEMFDLLKYMDAIVTVQDVTHPKPHPEPVLTAIQQLNADPKRTLMVGDSPADIKSAQAAGALSAAVAWSLKGAEELKKYNPDYILEDMLDLYGILGWELVKK